MQAHTKIRITVLSGSLALTALACTAEPPDAPAESHSAVAGTTPAAPFGRHPEELTQGLRPSRLDLPRTGPVLWGRAHLGHTVNKRFEKPAVIGAVTPDVGARGASPAPVPPPGYREKQQAYLRRVAEVERTDANATPAAREAARAELKRTMVGE